MWKDQLNSPFASIGVAVVDLCIIFIVSILVKGFFAASYGGYEEFAVHEFILMYGVLFILTAVNFDLYRVGPRKKFDTIVGVTIAAVTSSAVMVLIDYITFWSGKHPYRLLFCLICIYFALLLWRLVMDFLIHKLRAREKLLVIENKDIDIQVAKKIKYSCLDWFDSWYTFIDVNSEEALDAFLNGEFQQYSSIFITQSIPQQVKERLVKQALHEEKDVYFLPNAYDIDVTKYHMVQFDDIPSLKIKPLRLNFAQVFVKRVFDILLSLIGLLVGAPFMLLIVAAIKLESKGPVIYRQERVTRDRSSFQIYKFRTMVNDAEQNSGPVLAADDDERITKVGNFLRRFRLDELPQLLNIVKGDMSIIGPRPERPVFVEEFCREIPDYEKRFLVKAGLTGYAQVYSKYNTVAQDKLLYDLIYIREYSFLLDVKILFLTIKTIFKREATEGIKPPREENNGIPG